MKKRIITGIIATVLGVVTLCPVVASAENLRRFDVNGDSEVDILDYTLLRRAINSKGQIDKDGKLLTYVRGDVNGDGTLTKEDLEQLKSYLDSETVPEGMKAADANDDGKIDLVDFGTLKHAIEKNSQIDKGGVLIGYRIGDVNGDHVLDVKDLELLKQLI